MLTMLYCTSEVVESDAVEVMICCVLGGERCSRRKKVSAVLVRGTILIPIAPQHTTLEAPISAVVGRDGRHRSPTRAINHRTSLASPPPAAPTKRQRMQGRLRPSIFARYTRSCAPPCSPRTAATGTSMPSPRAIAAAASREMDSTTCDARTHDTAVTQ